MEILGVIKEIKEVETITSKAGKEYKKVLFILSNNDGYNGEEKIYAFEMFGEDKVDNFVKYNKQGDNVEVSFNIDTNEYNGKYYIKLSAWRVFKKIEGQEVQEEQFQNDDFDNDDDNLPF